MKRKKIYYWASNLNSNSGEGILANNFLMILKKKFSGYLFINLNKSKFFNNNFFYNYIYIFLGVIKIWYYNLKGYKTSYINYLPIWNIGILILLPQKTILGPITGTNTKYSIIYNSLKKFGIFILKKKWKKIIFSHSQFIKFFKKNNNKKYYNFLLYNFIYRKNLKKKYDFVIYYKKNSNKGNAFLIDLIKILSSKYKIAIIGDRINLKKNKFVSNFINLSRKKSLDIIAKSKYGIASKENIISYFSLDCLSFKLPVFFNKDLFLDKSISTNLLISIDFNNAQESQKIIEKFIKNKNKIIKTFKFKKVNFLQYF